MQMALYLVILSTEPGQARVRLQLASLIRNGNNGPDPTLPTTVSAIKLVYPKIVVDFLFLTSGGANSKSRR